jgi:hypothetical protein
LSAVPGQPLLLVKSRALGLAWGTRALLTIVTTSRLLAASAIRRQAGIDPAGLEDARVIKIAADRPARGGREGCDRRPLRGIATAAPLAAEIEVVIVRILIGVTVPPQRSSTCSAAAAPRAPASETPRGSPICGLGCS